MLLLVLLSGMFLAKAEDICDPGKCGPGQYYNQTNTQCEPCGVGTWLNKTIHGCHTCFNCDTLDDNPDKIVVVQCSPTCNTIFGCRENYTMSGDKCKEDMKATTINTVPITESSVRMENGSASTTNQKNGESTSQNRINIYVFIVIAVVGLFFAIFLSVVVQSKLKYTKRRQNNVNKDMHDQSEAKRLNKT